MQSNEKFKHTPGPWEEFPEYFGEGRAEDPLYRVIRGGGGYMNKEEKKNFYLSGYVSPYDSALMAAAPDLLEQLSIIYESFGGGNVITFSLADIDRIGAVIAKASAQEGATNA